MNLNKDKQNIYTIDTEQYIMYMHEQEEQQNSLLTKIIKFLLLTLLLIISYFLYQVVKSNQSFSEVFNKHELLSSYEKFKNRINVDNKTPKYVEQKKYIEVLAKKTAVLSVTKEYKKPIMVHNNSKVVKKVEEIKKEQPKETILSQKYLEVIAKELK